MRTKKVVVVKNFKSPYIEEVIFILKEDAPSDAPLPDAVEEAERIITGYLESLDCPRLQKKRNWGKLFVSLLGVLSFVGLVLVIF